MANVRFERVVSVTGEIKGHLAKNILKGEIDPKINWLCEKGSNKAAVILQLERPTVIKSIHIGNAHSAFVEILVGKAADASDQFESLVPVSSLMSPKESASGENQNRTRMFIKSDFSADSLDKAWDRIKVVCSQPFNKQVPFGLCFVHVQGEGDPNETTSKLKGMINRRVSEEEIQIGSFFKKARISEGSKDVSKAETSFNQVEKECSSFKDDSTDKMKAKLSTKATEKKTEKTSPPKEIQKESTKLKTSTPQKRKPMSQDKEKEDKTSDKKRKTKRKEKRPFERLLEGVVFVLSGFQNPLRGNIRNLALEMGAKYSPDWKDGCTHLVCACENTPKFKQVKGKGKIVRKEWLEKCHSDRKRYPWRKFALDKKDAKIPESEEEIEEETELDSSSSSESFLQKAHHSKAESIPEQNKRNKEAKDADADSSLQGSQVKNDDDDDDDDDNEYNLSTDEDVETTVTDTSTYPMPFLPDFLAGKSFYVDPNLKNRSTLERYIVAYNGRLLDTFDESVEFYLAEREDSLPGVITKQTSNVVVVKPSWIYEINSKHKYTSPEKHLVK